MAKKTGEMKTYVLLEHTIPTAPVYVQANQGQRVKVGARPVDHAYLQLTYTEGDEITDTNPSSPTFGKKIENPDAGKNRTIRLKLTSNTIYQDEQIKEGIPANAPFTQAERNAVRFRNGVLTTNNKVVQKFLEVSPQYEGFTGESADIIQPLYRLYDKTVQLKKDNQLFLKQLAAGQRIASLSLEEGKELMIKINGSFFKTPDTIEEVMAGLIEFMNSTDEDGLDKIINDANSPDEEITILIGKAIDKKIISFDDVPDQVVKIKGDGKFENLKEISSDHEPETRRRFFAEFLTSEAGKHLLSDIKKDVKAKEEKPKKVKEPVA